MKELERLLAWVLVDKDFGRKLKDNFLLDH